MTEEEILKEAAAIESAIETICHGRQSASVFVALSMVIGKFTAQAARPDFHGTMRLIHEGAFDAFRAARRTQRNGS